MLLFIDDPTRHTDEYILKHKLEALEKFQMEGSLRKRVSQESEAI